MPSEQAFCFPSVCIVPRPFSFTRGPNAAPQERWCAVSRSDHISNADIHRQWRPQLGGPGLRLVRSKAWMLSSSSRRWSEPPPGLPPR
jgi:hypothetical protein